MSSVFCFCQGNEQCEQSRQSTMGSLLTNRRIDLTVHSATARMSEGKAGANGALRVEFSTFPWFTWGFAQTRETAFLGEFTSNSIGKAPHKPRKLLSWGSLPQTLLGKLRTNQGNCFLGGVYLKFYQESSAQTPGQAEPIFTRPLVLRFRQGPARLLIASRPGVPLRGLNVGLCGDR